MSDLATLAYFKEPAGEERDMKRKALVDSIKADKVIVNA